MVLSVRHIRRIVCGVVLSLVAAALVAIPAGPAAAGSGVADVDVPIGAPVWTELTKSWWSQPQSGPSLPAGVPELRFVFPSTVTQTDVDPATVQLTAMSPDPTSGCGITSDGLRMDGWQLVVAPAVVLSKVFGTCTAGPWIRVGAEGRSARFALHMSLGFYLTPGTSAGAVTVALDDLSCCVSQYGYRTAPAPAAPGIVLNLVTPYEGSSGHFLSRDIQEQWLDTSGTPMGGPLSLPFSMAPDFSRLAFTLPATIPATASGMRVSDGTSGQAEWIDVPFTTPIADPVDAYVVAAYESLLGRGPDPVGQASWSAALRSGTPYQAVTNGITASDEFRSRMISEAYRDYLGRSPDAEGLRSWLVAMRGGLQIEAMQAGFIASPEYYAKSGGADEQWLAQVYWDVIHRWYNQAERQAWLDQLARGASRHDVALGFIYSTEHLTRVVNGYYIALLHRGIDPTGAAAWVSLIQGGHRDEEIVAGIVASMEYRSNVPRA